MCGCCGVGLWLVTLAEEKARQGQLEASSCQRPADECPHSRTGALASTSLSETDASAAKKLVDPKAKPWDDVRVWGAFLHFFGCTA
jgi:hypothetical protein